jgi:hypothetical protein
MKLSSKDNHIPTIKLAGSEWDFSPLVDHLPAKQRQVLSWEIGRTGGNGARAWLSLKSTEKPDERQLHDLRSFREISPADFGRFLNEFGGKPTSHAIFRDTDNPVDFTETPHILLIRWSEHRVEEIVSQLQKWARSHAKQIRSSRLRANDPMSDLWELSCYRLRIDAKLTFPEIATTLNTLPHFKAKRTCFDQEGARKAFNNAKTAIERHLSWLKILERALKVRKL